MRGQTRDYLDKFLENHPEIKSMLDVGSLDVSGNIRDLSEKRGVHYWGVDMRSGNNVDQVVNGHDLVNNLEGKYDLIVCFDTLEHDDAFWETVSQMRQLLDSGGWLMIGVPSRYCPEHDHPHDYWRFMPQMMQAVFLKDYLSVETIVDRNEHWEDEVYGWGQKP